MAQALSEEAAAALAPSYEVASAFTAKEAQRKAQAGEQLSITELEALLVRQGHGLLGGTSEEQERGEKLLLRIYERRSTTAGKAVRALVRRAHPVGSPGPEAPPAPAL